MTKIKKDKIVKIFVGSLRKRFRGQIKQIIMFGSRARGDYSSESDYDFILIFKKVTKIIKSYLRRLGGDLLLKHGAVVTDILLSENDYKRMRYEPFIINSMREGVNL